MRLADFMRQNPGVTVGGEGPWLVVYCRGRGVRYESYFLAHHESREACLHCDGSTPHAIVEIREGPPPKPLSRSYRRMVEQA